MANEVRIKRRVSGNAGAPAALKTAELAWNMVDDVVYGGFGDDGSGNATSIVQIGGRGYFAPLASPVLTGTPRAPTPAQSDNSTKIATTAFVQQEISSFGAGDMAKATYDTNDNGKVDAAEAADSVPWTGVTGKPSTFAPSAHSHAITDVTGLQTALDAKAPLDSPALTGAPTAPTQTVGNNTTRLATTEFVQAAISALIDAAPGTMDTLNELAAALGDDPDFATTVTASLAGKLTAANNLSDVQDAGAARGNLGLQSMATQAAGAVAITGGSISGVDLDGGTF